MDCLPLTLPAVVSLIITIFFFKIEKLRRKKVNWIKGIKIGLVSFSVLFVGDVLLQSYPFEGHFELSAKANVPVYLGFIATSLTAIYIYQTLNEQRKTEEEQKRANQISEFENRFFKFIDYHRENVANLKYRDPNSTGEKYFVGSQVFTVIYYEIRDLLNSYLKNSCDDRLEKAKAIDFIFQCVFFGAGDDGRKMLEKKFSNIDSIYFVDKKASYLTANKFGTQIRPKYYSGHVHRLGHYFRNIYQAVKYVDSRAFLDAKAKYDYITILRAQMTVYEQAVFFYNSLSELGDVWEWAEFKKEFPKDKEHIFNKLWMTKYDLIRNTLNVGGEISENINIHDFYPLLVLERENEGCKFKELPFVNAKKVCRYCFNEKYIKYHASEDERNLLEHIQENAELQNNFDCDENDCLTKNACKENGIWLKVNDIFSKKEELSNAKCTE